MTKQLTKSVMGLPAESPLIASTADESLPTKSVRINSVRIGSLRIGSLLIASLLLGGIGVGAAQVNETAIAVTRARQQAETPVAKVTTGAPSRFTFAWAAAEVPATIPLPLPPEVEAEDVTGVVLPGAVVVHGFAVDVDMRELVLSVSPVGDRREVSFDEISLLLRQGPAHRHPVGPVRLVSAMAGGTAFAFERSVSASGAGLHLGVALHNGSAGDLLLQGVEYWPQEMPPGSRLLVATAQDAETLLTAAERVLTPSRSDGTGSDDAEAAPSGNSPADSPVPVPGFRWLSAGQAVRVPTGHRLVIVWSAASLPDEAESSAFLLQPVVVFAPVANPNGAQRLGLPVVLRSRH